MSTAKEHLLERARALREKAASSVRFGRSAGDETTARNLLHYARELDREAEKLEAEAARLADRAPPPPEPVRDSPRPGAKSGRDGR